MCNIVYTLQSLAFALSYDDLSLGSFILIWPYIHDILTFNAVYSKIGPLESK